MGTSDSAPGRPSNRVGSAALHLLSPGEQPRSRHLLAPCAALASKKSLAAQRAAHFGRSRSCMCVVVPSPRASARSVSRSVSRLRLSIFAAPCAQRLVPLGCSRFLARGPPASNVALGRSPAGLPSSQASGALHLCPRARPRLASHAPPVVFTFTWRSIGPSAPGYGQLGGGHGSNARRGRRQTHCWGSFPQTRLVFGPAPAPSARI